MPTAATNWVIEQRPDIKNYFLNSEAPSSAPMLYSLCLFFENPNEKSFDLKELYNSSNISDMKTGIKAIEYFFHTSTYVLQTDTDNSSYLDGETPMYGSYMNQSEAARYLTEQGVPFTRGKVSVYVQRDTFPKPDLTVSNTNYWLKETLYQYASQRLSNKGNYFSE